MKRTALSIALISLGLFVTALPTMAGSDSKAMQSDKANKEDDQNPSESSERNASAVIKDAAITAMIKTSLLTNNNVSETNIEVETKRQIVTLKGKVKSNVESDLVEKIAKNTEDVKAVENELQVASR